MKTRETQTQQEERCSDLQFSSEVMSRLSKYYERALLKVSPFKVIWWVCVKCIVGKVRAKQAKQAEICGVCFCIFFIILEGQTKAKQILIFPTINKAKQAKQGQFNLFYYKGKVGKVEACSYLFLAKQSRQSRDFYFQL